MMINDPDDLSILPAYPDTNELLEAYKLCRMKLVRANRSRSALKGHDDHRRNVILDLQAQLEELEANLRGEAVTKTRIHELNARIAEILKVMETGNDEIASIVEEKGDTGITSWVIRVARIVPIMLRLREAKAKAVSLLGREVSSILHLPDIGEPTVQEVSVEVHTPESPLDFVGVLETTISQDWRSWDAPTWNAHLLDYCFFRNADEPAWAGIPATEEELRTLTGDEDGDPLEMAQRLVKSLEIQAAARKHPDGRSFTTGDFFQHQVKGYRHTVDCGPQYFSFLWLTCLIAQGYPDPHEEGEFHARYERVFGRRENQQLRLLPLAWDELALWLALDDAAPGTAHRRLELPPVDPGRRLISHSWKLSFPRRSDRKRLQEGFHRYACEGNLDPCSIDLVEFLHSFGGFARTFATELEDHLWKVRAGETPEDWFTGILRREITAWLAPFSDSAGVQGEVFGSLLLRRIIGEGYGLLVLDQASLLDPDFAVVDGEAFSAPGWNVLVDTQAAEDSWAAFDVGGFVLDRDGLDLPDASRFIDDGLLIFAADPRDGLPRLLLNPNGAEASHVLVDERKADDFLDAFGGSNEGCIEEGWTCIRGFDANATDLSAFRRGEPLQVERGAALVPIGGIPYLNGWLPTQLGLPWIRVRGSAAPESVLLKDEAGNQVAYDRSRAIGEEDLWKSSRDRAAITRLIDGAASFEADFPGVEQPLRRRLTIRALSSRARFLRKQRLAYREDWGRHLGPLICEASPPLIPPVEALHRAKTLVAREDRANPSLERELLDALCARFAKRSWISRHEFYGLYRRLDPNTGLRREWPLLMEGFLRAWCEGGWLEEGLEERRFLWRIHPIDPRLVRRPDGKARLVGLTSSSDLIGVVAWAMALGAEPPRAIRPANPRLPRGWEFSGDLETLASSTGLALVEAADWVADVTSAPWKVEPLDCDGPEWPPSPHNPKTQLQAICGSRQGVHIARNVAPGQRPNNSTAIVCEEQGFGRRRWRTEGRQSFVSTIRNRVCLAAAAEAGNRLWPFGFVEHTRIERLFDCDAYLPLPIGRAAALLGNEMPGPNLVDPSSHTHRYVLDPQTVAALRHEELVPLASWGP
jgi:hypothetical protein